MSTPQDQPRDDGDVGDEGTAHERDLEEVQRPMDDPQTRPALDPDVDPPETA